MKTTLTLNDLAKLLAERCDGLTDESQARDFILQYFNSIAAALQSEERVVVEGLGTFALNADTNKVSFAPTAELAQKINEPFSFFEAVELDDKYVDGDEPVEEESTPNEKKEGKEPVKESPVAAEVLCTDPPLKETEEMNVTEPAAEPVKEEPKVEPAEEPSETETVEETVEIAEEEPEPEETAPVEKEEEESSWHLPWWIPGLVGLFIGFAIGYGINLVTMPETADYEEDDEETELVETESAAVEQTETPSDTVVSPAEEKPAPVAEEKVEEKVTAAPAPDEPKTDTIKSGYYLTTMARKYYGDTNFWCYIYEENSANLRNPNQIPAGTVVVIPPAEKYGIDKNNPESLKRASAKIAEINARYK